MIIGLLAASILFIAIMNEPSRQARFEAAMEIWADEIRDADGLGEQLLRVSTRDEMEFGKQAADEVIAANSTRFADERYVTAVGNAVARHVARKDIVYEFHVIDSSEINAFALPGGQIFVTTGMLAFARSEAELACILGHEISHVDLRHCVSRYQYQLALGKTGAGPIGQAADLARSPFIIGYTRYEESEADEQDVTMAMKAGYDPRAMVDLLTPLEHLNGTSDAAPKPAGPVTEAVKASADVFETYLQSHPLNSQRITDLAQLIAGDNVRLGSLQVYEGVENYREQVAMNERRFPGESRSW